MPAQIHFKRVLRFVACICLILNVGCHSNASDTPSGWVPHVTPGGLHFSLPPGWNASGQTDGRINITGRSGEQATIWPVFLRTQLDIPGAQSVARTLGKKVWPGATWSVLPASANVVRMEGSDAKHKGMLLFSWTPTPKGTAGMLHLAEASPTQYRAAAPTFAQIFSSASIQGADVNDDSQAFKAIQYVRWRDPREGAFTVEVPAGYNTQGGMVRYAAIDTRPMVQSRSADGQVTLQAGDASIPGFAEPSPMLAMGGMNEGSWYNIGAGVRLMVRHYETGAQFASEYAHNASQFCSNVRIGTPRSRNDVTDAANRLYAQYQAQGLWVQINAGEVTVSCSKNGQPYSGYVFAGTQSTRGQGVAMWYVAYLLAYVAPAARDVEAREELKHMAETFRMDPNWETRQSQTALAVSKINAQVEQQISNTIMSGYESRQKTMDEISRRRENAILGEVDVVNTETGQKYKVDDTSNYYWVDGQGNIVGTQTHTRPDMNFQELMQMP